MRALTEFSMEQCSRIVGVLTDIDDTLTTRGRLTADAYQALEQMHEAGIRIIPVTGRPAGWCDHIARMWPVDAVVGENGAFWMRYQPERRRLDTVFADTPIPDRAEHLQALSSQILQTVPGSALASDQFCRLADLAIDFCEDVAPLDAHAISTIVALMQQAGMQAKVSSIHVNGWFGQYDKLSTTRRMLLTEFGINIEEPVVRNQWAFIGDSPNDAPMFGYFANSVGVANVLDFAGQLPASPTYRTNARAGAGFVEFARMLLNARH